MSSLSAVMRPPWKLSAVAPSKSTTAPCGGLAPSVGLLRSTFLSVATVRSPDLMVIRPSRMVATRLPSEPAMTTAPSLISPSAEGASVAGSQPSPGSPPR